MNALASTNNGALVGTAAAVLLDMDGTLVLSEPVHHRAWKKFFHRWEIDVDDLDYQRTYMGRRAADVIAEVPGPWTGTDIAAAIAEMNDYALLSTDAVQVVAGATALIEQFHADNTPIAVVTSAGTDWAERVLSDVLGVRSLVDIVVSAADVVVGKPSPEGYFKACQLLGVPPKSCLAFEDSPAGVAALTAAGVAQIIGVTTTSNAEQLRAAGAHWTVPDLAPNGIRDLLGAAGA
ncbi:MAG: HAD family phosphatase [Gordonia sp. (in: high G+C Gram-positive bacteria)]